MIDVLEELPRRKGRDGQRDDDRPDDAAHTTIHHMVGTRLAVENHDLAHASLLKHALCLVVVARLHALFHDFSIRLSAGDDR